MTDTRTGRRGNRPLEVRMPAERRLLVQRVAATQGTTAPDLVREFLAWYLGEPGAELPARPEVTRDDLRRPG